MTTTPTPPRAPSGVSRPADPMKVHEECSCGSKVDVETVSLLDADRVLHAWRVDHRHPDPAAPADNGHSTAEGSITSTAYTARTDDRPPLFGFQPRRSL